MPCPSSRFDLYMALGNHIVWKNMYLGPRVMVCFDSEHQEVSDGVVFWWSAYAVVLYHSYNMHTVPLFANHYFK